MFISPSPLPLNSPPASTTIAGSIHSATVHPLPDMLPLSTPLVPPLNQSSTLPSSYLQFSPRSRSSPFVGLSSTMLPPGATVNPYYLSELGVIITSSQSNAGVSVTFDSQRLATDTRTSAGTNLPPSSAPSSNSDVSPSLISRSAPSGTTLSTPFSSVPSSSLSTNSPYTSGFTSVPMSSPPLPTTSPPTVSSYSSPLLTNPSVPSSPVSTSSQPFSTPEETWNSSFILGSMAPLVSPTMLATSAPSSSALNPPSTSTYVTTSFVTGQGSTVTEFITTSNVLSTEPPGRAVNGTAPLSPGTIAAIVLGIIGAAAFSALWLFCSRRRHRNLMRQAPPIPLENHAPGPLDDEIQHAENPGYATGNNHSAEDPQGRTANFMEERHTSILAALHSTGLRKGNEGESTGGIYGSRHDTAADMDGNTDIVRTSSPTLPLHVLPPDDPPYTVPLSPPPPVSQSFHHQTAQPVTPPSSYHLASRRKSSPGPDAATLLSGYSGAPSYSSYYAHSQILGSGSASGSVDALTRTQTGSEEPLLGIGKPIDMSGGSSTLGGISPTTVTDSGGNMPGLGSAFWSPPGSMHSPGSAYSARPYDASESYGTRSVSGSGYSRSATPSSFDVLRNISSQGGLSSAYSQEHCQRQGFRFEQGSAPSTSIGMKTGRNLQSFGVPPTTFKAWKDWGSDKEKRSEKQSLREKDGKQRPQSWTSSASASGSMDEMQGRGSPIMGVRAFLGRFRHAGHTPSPHSSNKDLSSPTKTSTDVDPEKVATDRVTSPPIEIEPATPQRRRFSFILSNPDPNPPSLCSGAGVVLSSGTLPNSELRSIQRDAPAGDSNDSKPVPFSTGGAQPETPFPTGHVFAPAPSPAPTDESLLAEGLLHPRLRTQGDGDASLRDFEDYSRPIGGVVKNRLYSTTTFGTQDETDRSRSGGGTPEKDMLPVDEHEHEIDVTDSFGPQTLRSVPQDSWLAEDLTPPTTIGHSPAEVQEHIMLHHDANASTETHAALRL